MGTLPRCFKADRIYSNTQRTVDRSFLFKPCDEVRNFIGASAARAQQKHPVKIYWLDFNINHEHEGIAPISNSLEHLGNMVKFKQTFHRILAEELNRFYGREGAIFSSAAHTVPCLDDESVEDRFFYALTNPVKDGLVDRLRHWKGFSSYAQLALGKTVQYTYYDRTAWHRHGKVKPLEAYVKTIRLEYSPIPSLAAMKPARREAYIRRKVRMLEQEFREAREVAGTRVIGPAKLAKTDPRDRPSSRPKSYPIPICHCSCPELRNCFKCELVAFLEAYITASERYRQGAWDTEFPKGSFRPPLIEVAA